MRVQAERASRLPPSPRCAAENRRGNSFDARAPFLLLSHFSRDGRRAHAPPPPPSFACRRSSAAVSCSFADARALVFVAFWLPAMSAAVAAAAGDLQRQQHTARAAATMAAYSRPVARKMSKSGAADCQLFIGGRGRRSLFASTSRRRAARSRVRARTRAIFDYANWPNLRAGCGFSCCMFFVVVFLLAFLPIFFSSSVNAEQDARVRSMSAACDEFARARVDAPPPLSTPTASMASRFFASPARARARARACLRAHVLIQLAVAVARRRRCSSAAHRLQRRRC